jgi:hypothetical protein
METRRKDKNRLERLGKTEDWRFHREQLAVGFLTWRLLRVSVNLRASVRRMLAVPPRLRALCASARKLLAISLVPAALDCGPLRPLWNDLVI